MTPYSLLSHSARKLGLRGLARRVRVQIGRTLGYADPYHDLASVGHIFRTFTFLDIGCHHGRTIERFWDVAGRTPAIGFDPDPHNIATASAYLGPHAPVRFFPIAISDEDSTRSFFLNKNEQTSSLLENGPGNHDSFATHTAHVATIEVDVVRLDTWAAQFFSHGTAVIKCDTQGAEAKVIRGGLTFIRERVAAFYGEVMLGDMYEGQATFQEIRDLLEGQCGMVIRAVYPCLHDGQGRAVQFDALWVKPDVLGAFS